MTSNGHDPSVSKHYDFKGALLEYGGMISCLVLDNVCIYCKITFYCLLPSFLQIHNFRFMLISSF